MSLFGHLGALGLLGPDEPRYAWIARAMASTGDWVTPRLYGLPWFEKPVLYYWAAAAGFCLRLPAEWAARLPSALAALAAALPIGWLGWRHYGNDGGLRQGSALFAPAIFATSAAGIGFARAATPDMLFSASLALAMASASTVLADSGVLRTEPPMPAGAGDRKARPLVLFGAFLGLAALAKGPAGVLLSGGAIALWTLATRQWRAALRFFHPYALIPFCIVALPWYAVCAWRNPDFLRIFLWQHNFERYLTPVFHHPQPFWFFGPITLLALFPWTFLLWPAARAGLRLWRAKSWDNSPGLFFACWAAFPVIFFSFSQSKLPSYILPGIPPLALVCAIAAVRMVRESRRMSAALCAGIGATWVALCLAVAVFARRMPWANQMQDSPTGLATAWTYLFVGIGLAGAAAVIVAGVYGKSREALVWCAVCIAAALEFSNMRVLPIADAYYSARPHAEFLRADQRPDRIFAYRLDRNWNYGLAFYFGRELPEWQPADPEPALLLTNAKGFQEIRSLGRFHDTLDEQYVGILYVPIPPAPR